MINPNPQTQRLLRLALAGNALFSLASGTIIVLQDHRIVRLLGLPEPNSLLSLGISLVVFAALLFLSARREVLSVSQARIIVWMDLLWVAGSAVLLFLAPFSAGGKWAVGIVAEFVLGFAIVQWLGIRKIRKGSQYA